ncbi:MAG: HEPN domain-containing protein [Planctomycetes bacterium]|nr:HEPN domain-containing protein [Planctomycetota bacterium]
MKKDVQKHLESAEDFLRESEYLYSGGFFRGTIGRAYYAMFHAATALLLHKGIERSSHHAIISAFGEYLAQPRVVDPKFHKYFIEAFTLRNDCDYLAPFAPEEAQARTTLQRAREFVATCRELCL